MTPFEERYAKLNAEQKLAVDTVEGAVLVVAGPGSGKTEILALRVARILQETDASPTSILCLTFTDSAASTMRSRLAQLIGPEAYRVQVGTFHAFAQQAAERFPAYFAGGAEQSVAEPVEQRELVAEAIRELPVGNPLRVPGHDGAFTYLADAATRISELKRAGIGPDAFEQVIAHTEVVRPQVEEILAVFNGTVSRKRIPEYAQAAEALRTLKRPPFPLQAFVDLPAALARSLEGAILETEASEGTSATPLSEWKGEHFLPKGAGLRVTGQLPRLASLALVYRRYRELLAEGGLRDFDDLLVDLIDALRDNPELRAELQEEYHYVLVDEFQDTNGAQAELLALIADHDANNGNPNLMVVGDDDQAIYRFHGAGLEHLLGFAEKYPQATVMTMTTNYRSHQAILDLARAHIRAAKERLEGRLPNLTKQLVQGGAHPEVEIAAVRADSREDERDMIAALVQERLDAGVPAQEIAVIGRRNSDLEELASHLADAGIRVSYDRQRDALADAHVIELVETARVATAISGGDAAAADPLLPNILSYPFWGIPRLAVWKLARQAFADKKPWLDLMTESEEPAIKAAAELLIDVGSRSGTVSAEQLIDELVGTVATPEGRQSPFRLYHFGAEARTERPEELLALTGALRSVLAAFRESLRGKEGFLPDLVRFADLRREHKQPVSTRIAPGASAVHLLTAHKAKGMEFDTVILLHASTDVWYSAGRVNKISLPENLPISSSGSTMDDYLRTLYVAITRAKRRLYLAVSPGPGRRSGEPLPLLEGVAEKQVAYERRERTALAWAKRVPPITGGERDALLPLVADYRLTPTQLNDFLNVADCGPQEFFMKHVLRFPQHQSVQIRFGNAVHAALERIVLAAHQGTPLPDEAGITDLLAPLLASNGFAGKELGRYLAHGAQAIAAYCAQRPDELLGATHVEVSFSKDQVMVGNARVTGKADVIREEPDGLVITDYKTGKAGDWDDKDARKAVQRVGNRRQLLFYAILAEGSGRFPGKRVKEAKLAFVVPDRDGAVNDLVLTPEPEERDRTERLIQAVYARVMALDFPDIEKYSKDTDGIRAFEDDLLTEAGKEA